MNSKVTIVLAVAILVSTFALQTEAFTMGAGGFGKRQQVSCAETENKLLEICAVAATVCRAPGTRREMGSKQ